MNNDEAGASRPATAGRKRGLIVGISLVALGLGAIWWQRAPIATQLIDRELARRGVPASYRIAQLTHEGATLTGLVIGRPEAPDLVAGSVRVEIGWTLGGTKVRQIAVDDVLLRGQLGPKGLTFGTLDRLRPAPSNEPFTLPDFDLRLRNARLRLATPAGQVGIAAEGKGRLADGFRGRVAIAAPRLNQSACVVSDSKALFKVHTNDRQISLSGPAGVAALRCTDGRSGPASALVSATIPESLDKAQGRINLSARTLVLDDKASAASLGAEGQFDLATAQPMARFNGSVRWEDLSADNALRARMARATTGPATTPIGPLSDKAFSALSRAMESADGSVQIALNAQGKSGYLTLSDPGVRSASGAQLTGTGQIIEWRWPSGEIRPGGTMALSGGGLPEIRLAAQSDGPGAWYIRGSMMPYAANGARLAASPFSLDWKDKAGRLTAHISLDGPIADGRIEGLILPLYVRFTQTGEIRLTDSGDGCLNIAFVDLKAKGLVLSRSKIPLCSANGRDTLFAMDTQGRLAADLHIPAVALQGRFGTAPVTIGADNGRFSLGGNASAPDISFSIGASAVRMQQPEGDTYLTLAGLTGRTAGVTLEGRLSDAAGAIANVPLLVDQASGRWRYAQGLLTLSAPSARVRDAAAERRFEPVLARDIGLRLKDGAITGDAVLAHPASGKQLALLKLRHDLSATRGNAVLEVPKLAFGDDLQPEQLTPLTLGIIANVGGTISGEGHIRWSEAGVTSDGMFETPGIGLSAAFGQVHNIRGRIVFDDLLGMTTPPGQTVTLGEVNTGVTVKDGTIRYQLLPEQHVKVEEGRWPFSGGELILEPTTLDFGKPSDRIFTLTVVGLDAAQFIQQFDFKNFAATGLFDGKMPLLFNEKGGRIVGGRLVARREGGTLAYVGEVSDADMGGAGKLAFDALKSMKYSALVLEMDGELDGEIISTVLFNGVNQAPVNPSGGSLPVKGTGFPFKFNITVRAPFRALLNTAESFTDVRTTVKRALPPDTSQLPGTAPVQPPASEDKR